MEGPLNRGRTRRRARSNNARRHATTNTNDVPAETKNIDIVVVADAKKNSADA